jgi:hypothetical protein
MSKNIVCVDFDGVLNNYSGWKGETELYTPRTGVKEFMGNLRKDYRVVVFTTRDNEKVREWLEKYDILYDDITSTKQGAVCYIDDRALKFNGDFNETLIELSDFKTHWEQDNTKHCHECDDFGGRRLIGYTGKSRVLCLKTWNKYVYPDDEACDKFTPYKSTITKIMELINRKL